MFLPGINGERTSSDLKIGRGLLKYPACSFTRNIQLMHFISTVPLCFVVSWECQKPTYQRTSPKTKISCFLAALTFFTVQQDVFNMYYLVTYAANSDTEPLSCL